MKKILLLQVIFYFSLINIYGQNKNGIKMVKAFFTSTFPGMARVDENGNRINPQPYITRFLYVETIGKAMPFFDTINYTGTLFKCTILADSSTVKVGVNAKDGIPIILKAQKGNAIWKIDLQLLNNKQKNAKAYATSIFVKGKIDNATFKINLNNEIELNTPDSY